MIQTDRITEIICKHKINPTQIYILWLLYTRDDINLEKYIQVFGNFKRTAFEELIEKGLLLWTNPKAESFRVWDLVVTLEFADELSIIEPEDAWDELFSNYPGHLLVNGKKYPAKTLTFPDEKSAKGAYKEIISKNKFVHQQVLAALNKWKEQNNGYATIKIDKFIAGRYWEEIGKEEDNGTARTSYY